MELYAAALQDPIYPKDASIHPSKMIPMEISNVMEYFNRHQSQAPDPRKLPALPFPKIWMEGVHQDTRWAILTDIRDMEEPLQPETPEFRAYFPVRTMRVTGLIHYPDEMMSIGRVLSVWSLGTQELVWRSLERFSPETKTMTPVTPEDDPDIAGFTTAALQIVGLTSQFIQCKNVRLVDTQMAKTRQERRYRERHGLPLITYKTIQVDPDRVTIVGGDTSKDKPLGLNPLHIVRGNFATYTESRKLFGKYTGTFWRPAHVRGKAENGVVRHSYVVDHPREEQADG